MSFEYLLKVDNVIETLMDYPQYPGLYDKVVSWAAARGHTDILLEMSEFSSVDGFNKAFWRACENNQLTAAQWMLDTYPDCIKPGYKYLKYIIKNNNTHVLEWLNRREIF